MEKQVEFYTRQRAAGYRKRAAEVRALALSMSTVEGRKTLLEVALDYERMADAVLSYGSDRSGKR